LEKNTAGGSQLVQNLQHEQQQQDGQQQHKLQQPSHLAHSDVQLQRAANDIKPFSREERSSQVVPVEAGKGGASGKQVHQAGHV
jgi:hypothetical protein